MIHTLVLCGVFGAALFVPRGHGDVSLEERIFQRCETIVCMCVFRREKSVCESERERENTGLDLMQY